MNTGAVIRSRESGHWQRSQIGHFRSLATDSFPAFRPDKKTPDEFYFEALPAIPLA